MDILVYPPNKFNAFRPETSSVRMSSGLPCGARDLPRPCAGRSGACQSPSRLGPRWVEPAGSPARLLQWQPSTHTVLDSIE